MDKKIFLNEVKKDLQLIVQSMDLSNVEEKEMEMTNYFTLLKSLNAIKNSTSEYEMGENQTLVKESDTEERGEIDEYYNSEATKKMYRFERLLRGGIVPEIDGFIPESVIRNLQLEHGDFVYAEEIESYDSHKKRFEYSFAKAGDRSGCSDRVQINFAVVTSVAGKLAIDSYLEGSEKKELMLDELPYTLVLNEADIDYLRIKEGAIIDLAFSREDPNKHKVLWVHEIIEKNKALTSGQKNKYQNTKEDRNNNEDAVEQTLAGKTVLVVGNEPKKALYKKAIEMRGGVFMFADSNDKVESFEPKVRKCDQVIFLLKVSGHTGMKHIKALCKQYDIPFDETWSTGITSVTRMAESV